MTQLSTLRILLPMLVLVGPATAGSEHRSRPNIVLIVSDDHGYRDLGCFGSEEIRTPNLDRLAAGGVRLTNFYVAWPACTPSRASLLTGRYPQRNGMYDMVRNEAPDYGHKYSPAEYAVTFERIGGLDEREILLPRLLADAGYRCGIFGKWDLGMQRRFLPTARGFHTFYGFVNTGIDYFTHERYGVPSMYAQDRPTVADRGTYCTELFRREAVRFVKENRQSPFFLYLPFNAPHGASSLDPKVRGAAQAPEKYKQLYPHLEDDWTTSTRKGNVAVSPSRSKRRLEYAASITCMDDAIGAVLSLLDEYKLAENTIVLFHSDNGGAGGADNTPLRGGKSTMFEGGLRVPGIVRYPRGIPAGRTSDAFLTTLEVVPTLLKLTGTPAPKDLILDGFDMLPTLAADAPSPRTEMFWQRRDDKAARIGAWKWIESQRGGGLFNLADDIAEKNDLSAAKPAKVAELKHGIERWTAQMQSAEPRGPFRDY